MRKYITRRLLLMIPVLIGISIIIFSLINLAPGDPYSSMIDPNFTAADKENMLNAIGYYEPLPVKYVKWVSRAVQGDLGFSIRYKEPVVSVIMRSYGNTIFLTLISLSISVLIAVPLGVISATHKYSVFDYIVTVFSFIGLSIPVFFLAMLMIKFLAFDLDLFPISGMQSIGSGYTGIRSFFDHLHHMVLPIAVLGLTNMASLMRYTRSSMLEVITQDYIRTARAKGVKERVVIYRHALKNALIPIVTVVCMSLGYMMSGAILTETVFVWPGMGTLVYQAILNRDYPLVTASTMLIAFFILASNLLADILYAFLDPRIKYN
ncbi:ABC transporter permease [Desulfosporosinus metallidurans]|uniref:Oligopeptide transport system permease protein OppB n=1 Tax=Desulfosporosinus metallidurans TaxID=1888891 RepID=A0A1Q8R0A3_9FIRM|nr:ABC transporter permease [Desulfosporosinus metallidurans]OLN32981.1 Oligopeptide transport system permease protein OppB [Desulfosporosinus metallidurans]